VNVINESLTSKVSETFYLRLPSVRIVKLLWYLYYTLLLIISHFIQYTLYDIQCNFHLYSFLRMQFNLLFLLSTFTMALSERAFLYSLLKYAEWIYIVFFSSDTSWQKSLSCARICCKLKTFSIRLVPS